MNAKNRNDQKINKSTLVSRKTIIFVLLFKRFINFFKGNYKLELNLYN